MKPVAVAVAVVALLIAAVPLLIVPAIPVTVGALALGWWTRSRAAIVLGLIAVALVGSTLYVINFG